MTVRQADFVTHYLENGGQGAQAAVDAGYAVKSAKQQAHILLNKVHVRQALSEARDRLEVMSGVRVEHVVRELARIAFTNISDIVTVKDGRASILDSEQWTKEQRAAVESIQETKFGIRVKMHSKPESLRMLGQHLAMFIERHEVGAPGAFSELTDDELQRELLELEQKRRDSIPGHVVGAEEEALPE